MDLTLIWRKFLVEWPPGLTRGGVLVTELEQIAFVDFLLAENVGLFERRAPDTVGARRVVVPYSKIEAIKIVDSVNDEVFTQSGFRGPKTET